MSQKVVIIGSGVFGMSTALWMLQTEKDKYDVTILEKCETVPAPDAASTDINKIIRAGDYADPELSALSVEAVEMWKRPEWEGCYHESGVMCLSGSDPRGTKYVQESYKNCNALNLEPRAKNSSAEIKGVFPPGLATGAFPDRVGYHNVTGGWAESGRSIEIGLRRVQELGGKILAGAEVMSFQKANDGKTVTGVVLKDGRVIPADLVVVAAGAWTPGLLESPAVAARLPPIVASGQTVCIIQLTPEEAAIQSKVPVVFNLDNGFYIFPPTADGKVKMAIHNKGWTSSLGASAFGSNVSVPRTKLSSDADLGTLPAEAVHTIRAHLRDHYPELAKKPFADVRMCWYCDTVTGDWLVDYHPDFSNLFVATGCSGHAFKFAPNLGREVLALIERRPTQFTDRFSFAPTNPHGADYRGGEIREINLNELAGPADLLPFGRPSRL
ncbi:hypothetical protein CspHIS471_0509110 [Cutaneotrichosporon sp. HIS471]|nr:hypothetical protein CspHIS471_0509110 [Cutaneotrichosporon sp. HIS471]